MFEVSDIAQRSVSRAVYGMPVPHAPLPDASERSDQNRTWVELIDRIRTDADEAAFADLFRHFAPRVKAFLKKGGAEEALAEDCMQDVMATVWRKAHLFDATRASAATWIFTIARNRRIDLYRRWERTEPDELPWGPEPEPEQSEAIVLKQEVARLTRAIDDLPKGQRELVIRAYYGDLTHRELADQTGLPLGTIKSRLRLALERLRHAMRG